MEDLELTKQKNKGWIKESIVNVIDKRHYTKTRRLQEKIEGMQEDYSLM